MAGMVLLGVFALLARLDAADEPVRAAAADPAAAAAVANYLLRAYPPAQAPSDRPAYNPRAPLRRLELKALEPSLPEMRFLATSLASRSDPGGIGVVVAVGRGPDGQWRGLAACLDPLQVVPTREFLDLFRGIRADPDTRFDDFTDDIARIFGAASRDGHLGGMNGMYGEFVHDLSSAKLRRYVAIAFGADRRISEVRLYDPERPPLVPAWGSREADRGPHAADPTGRDAVPDPMAAAAANYIIRVYPGTKARGGGPGYIPSAPLRRLELKALESCLPETRFLITSLGSGSDFGEVSVVAAVTRGPGGEWRGRAACLNPLYRAPSPEFLDLFRGVPADHDTRPGDLAADVARIFEALTYDGNVRETSYEDGEFRYDIYSGDQGLMKVPVIKDGRVVTTEDGRDVTRYIKTDRGPQWVVGIGFGADRRISRVRLFRRPVLRPAVLPHARTKKGGPDADEPVRRAEAEAVSAAAADYLRKTFPPDGGPAERPCYDPEAPLRGLELKALRTCLPGARFVLTRLRPRPGSPEVGVVVAVVRGPGEEWRGRAACLSLLYEEPGREFLDLFQGVRADPPVWPGRLADDIARLLAATLPDGRVGPPNSEEAEYREDLYTGRMYWRTLVVAFDENRRVTAVRLVNRPPAR